MDLAFFVTDIFLVLTFNRQPRPEAGEMCKDAESIDALVLSLPISDAEVSLPTKDQEPIDASLFLDLRTGLFR